jgi:hypothetical protein
MTLFGEIYNDVYPDATAVERHKVEGRGSLDTAGDEKVVASGKDGLMYSGSMSAGDASRRGGNRLARARERFEGQTPPD